MQTICKNDRRNRCDQLQLTLGSLDSEFDPGLCLIFLPRGKGPSISGSQTLPAVIGNRAIDDGAAIEAFPGIKHEKEVREPL